MKRFALVLALFYAHFNLLWSQSWVQPEATWHHSYGDASSGVIGHVVTTVQGDTLLNDTLAHRLSGVLHGYSEQTQQYVTQDAAELFVAGTLDLAFAWTGAAFDTLFHFAAVPGDHWQPPGATGGDLVLTVLDTGHATVDGAWLRYLVMDLGPFTSQPSPDTLFERLGLLHGYLDVWSSYLLDVGIAGLRCYSDADLSYASDDTPCDQILGTGEMERSSPRLSVYPNPGQDLVRFKNATHFERPHLRVLDGRGASILEKKLVDIRAATDLSHLPPGCYSIQLTANDGRSAVARWVKY